MHDRFDAARWVDLFPLEAARHAARKEVLLQKKNRVGRYRGLGRFATKRSIKEHTELLSPYWDDCSSPRQVAYNLQLRAERGFGEVPDGAVPTDVFVFAVGEPSDRSLTKLSGLPYWPVDHAWPKSDDGRPMEFLAQFNFRDSTNIVPGIPGDVLLVFADFESELSGECFRYFWQDIGEQALVSRVPVEPGWLPVYGQIFRTWDHADQGIWQGTKIGGLPYWVQYPERLPGRYLATLGSVGVRAGKPWPFVNQETPFGEERHEPLVLGDAGAMPLYVTEDHKIHAVMQCH